MHDFCDKKDNDVETDNKAGIKKEYELLLRQYAREQGELWGISENLLKKQLEVKNSQRAIKAFVDKYSKELEL